MPAKGHRQTDDAKRRISAAKRGVPKPPGFAEAMALARRGVPTQPCSEAAKAKISAANLRRKPAASTIAASRAARRNNPDYSRRRSALSAAAMHRWAGRYEFLDARGRLWKFRSSWERRFASHLDEHGLTWNYEPDRLLLSSGKTYIPDFWVAEWNSYVEIKGWRGWGDITKVDQARADGHRVILIDKTNLDAELARPALDRSGDVGVREEI